jgi:hypothetical protein
VGCFTAYSIHNCYKLRNKIALYYYILFQGQHCLEKEEEYKSGQEDLITNDNEHKEIPRRIKIPYTLNDMPRPQEQVLENNVLYVHKCLIFLL